MTEASPPPERVRFADLPLSDHAQAGLQALGYEFATPVQAAVFEKAMTGRDLMVQSKTGTGKTTAFGLPVMERIRMEGGTDPQALVLCPTRELAVQVAEELAELGDPKGVRVLPIYGGAPMGPQLKSLKAGCDVIVGTPGRVLDHIRRRTLRLVHAHMAVLDEADEMLSMGFWEDVMAILEQLPEERQTLLFSATLPDTIRRTALRGMKDPETVDISRDELTVEGITNIAYEADDRLPKPRNLLYILEIERPENAIIFCNTRDDASIVAAFLRRQGLHALALSGELNQRDREKVMRRMKSGELQYLVATDIAARGIDISDLSHVMNYSLPDFTEVYLHRVGRTGRAGRTGTAVSLVSGRDQVTLTSLKRDFKVSFETRELPEFSEIVKRQALRVATDLQKRARETEVTSFLRLAQWMLETEQAIEALAYLLKQHFSLLEEARARDPLEAGRPDEEGAPEAEADEERPRAKDRKPKKKDKKKDGRREERRAPQDGRQVGDVERLFVNRGISDGYDEQKIRILVTEAAGKGDGIGKIQLRRTHSFVEVTPQVGERAIAAATEGIEREDKPVTIEAARTRG
ncbi:MAG: DEAD/DEAH box helicase [Myxococcota bacterium]